jgi:hypothetical protein
MYLRTAWKAWVRSSLYVYEHGYYHIASDYKRGTVHGKVKYPRAWKKPFLSRTRQAQEVIKMPTNSTFVGLVPPGFAVT